MEVERNSLKKNFIRYIIPSIIAQWVFTLYTIVDGIFVARGVSEAALTAVNIAMPYTMSLFSIAITFGIGTASIIAIRLGQRDENKAREIFSQNMYILLAVAIVITVVMWLNLDKLAVILGATGYNYRYVKEYLGIIIPFTTAAILSYAMEMQIKAEGFPARTAIIVTCGSIMNVILDYFMVLRWGLGIRGAGFATGISNTMVMVLYLCHFFRRKGVLRFVRVKFTPGLLLRACRNGLASGITEISAGVVIFMFNQAVVRYIGNQALVSYTIISYINSLAVMTMVGIAQGYQPLVGYYYGRRQDRTCMELLKYGNIAALVTSVLFTAGVIGGSPLIVKLFVSSDFSALRDYSVTVLRIFSLSFLVVGYNVVTGGFFIAVERAKEATLISLSRSLVMLLICLVFLICIFGGEGIWWTPLVSETVTLVLTCVCFRGYIKKEHSCYT